jgi:plastocyanin
MPSHSSMRSLMLGLAAALLLVACSSGHQPPASGNQSAAAGAGAGAAGAHTVVIKGFKYDPPTLTVKAGDTVEWKNEDIVPHTATAAELNHARAFDSGSIANGGSWKWVARTPGTYDYICTLHPNMKGRLVVQ